MNEQTEQAIRAHALQEFPREACGLIAIVKGREIYFPCSNAAATPMEHFVIPGDQYAEIEERGEIIAVVHSHPNASSQPSQGDLVACEKSGLAWHIVSVGAEGIHGPVRTIEPSGYVAPLVGRQFVHGVLDCYSLIQDWYARERSIALPNFERQDKWWERGDTLYMDHFEEAGFQPVNGGKVQVGDIFLMQIRASTPNHAAVYIGDGLILHHMYGRLSSRDVYGGYWREVTRMMVRR